MPAFRRTRGAALLALLAALGLLYDAYVHLHLAGERDAVGTAITQGALFRLEAGTAIAAAVSVLISDRRAVWAFAGTVGLAGLVAVVLYTYVDVPAIGPIPAMYEPVWFAEKAASAVAEGLVAAVWCLRELVRGSTVRRQAGPASASVRDLIPPARSTL